MLNQGAKLCAREECGKAVVGRGHGAKYCSLDCYCIVHRISIGNADRIRRERHPRSRGKVLTLRKLRFSPEELSSLESFDHEPLPKTRGECQGGARPCPMVSCRHNLFLEVTETGGLKFTFPDLEVWELKESCALDVAEREGVTLQQVATMMNLTRERIRQIEARAVAKLDGKGIGE
jgi:hypothetical protein